MYSRDINYLLLSESPSKPPAQWISESSLWILSSVRWQLRAVSLTINVINYVQQINYKTRLNSHSHRERQPHDRKRTPLISGQQTAVSMVCSGMKALHYFTTSCKWTLIINLFIPLDINRQTSIFVTLKHLFDV